MQKEWAMRTVRFILFSLLVLMVCNATAQTQPRLRILVEKLDQDAATCGVNESILTSIATLTLRNNGIQGAIDILGVNALYIVSNILLLSNRINCVYNLSIEIRGYEPIDFTMTPLSGFASKLRKTVLCHQGGVGISPLSDTSRNILSMLENQIKLCLGEMQY